MAKFGINDIIDIKSKSSDTDGANEYKEIWLNPYELAIHPAKDGWLLAYR